jgi:hypothetical protein
MYTMGVDFGRGKDKTAFCACRKIKDTIEIKALGTFDRAAIDEETIFTNLCRVMEEWKIPLSRLTWEPQNVDAERFLLFVHRYFAAKGTAAYFIS